MNRTFILSMLIICAFAAGCETSRGVGKDMENTGQNIRETVDKND
jgi:predicted small secreted protein